MARMEYAAKRGGAPLWVKRIIQKELLLRKLDMAQREIQMQILTEKLESAGIKC